MTALHVPGVRRTSVRVALVATGFVAMIYAVIAVVVLVLVTSDLTTQIDRSLERGYERARHDQFPPGNGFQPPPGQRPDEAPFVIWFVAPDGTVTSSASGVDLPAEHTTVTGPQTITIDGLPIRVKGGPGVNGYVVVGQWTRPISQTQGTIVLAGLLIAPVLLAVVFLGAYTIGSRVAGPIERARRRQLDFTADASHELRTPVSVIEANTSLALAGDRSAEWYRTTFERVNHETQRMRRLLDDLLWLARFDAAGGPPNAEPVDLGVLAARTVDRFGSVAEARQLTLSVRSELASLVISAPPDWLDRLVGVLVDNACKYSTQGGAVTVSVGHEGGRIRLSVDDSGPGIPEEERLRIFDRFHRATEGGSGAGLGLAIADAIVRATGGRWRMGSSPSGGASMTVTWPRALGGGQAT